MSWDYALVLVGLGLDWLVGVLFARLYSRSTESYSAVDEIEQLSG